MITSKELAEIRAKAEAATAGPWRQDGYNLYGDPDSDGWIQIAVAECHRSPIGKGRYRQWEKNAAHIARMDPPTTLRLLDALAEQAEEIRRLREARDVAVDIARAALEDKPWQA